MLEWGSALHRPHRSGCGCYARVAVCTRQPWLKIDSGYRPKFEVGATLGMSVTSTRSRSTFGTWTNQEAARGQQPMQAIRAPLHGVFLHGSETPPRIPSDSHSAH